MNDFVIVICAFLPERLSNFLENFSSKKMGMDADIVFIHNSFEPRDIKNRYVRSDEDILKISNMLRNFKCDNKIIIERENVGEDLGAYHFAFNLLKEKYKYFFFMNEATVIYEDNWLKYFYDIYENDENIYATTPQICRGIKYDFCLPTTYWSIRTSFGKELVWDKPLNRQDVELQEMELIWPQVKQKNGYVAQVKNNLMGYKNQTCFSEGLY